MSEEENNRKFKRCKIPDTSYPEISEFVSDNCQEIEFYEESKYYPNNENFELEKNSQLAEMIGIILGDGSIAKNKCRLRITLNKTEEPQYTQYVIDLMQKVFNKKPSIYEPNDANAIKLSINSKKIVEALIDKGLKPGDKKKNQVNVPQWIKKNKEYLIKSLRGIIDTDGTLHVHKYNNNIRIGFKNGSYPLVKDFKEMCESIGVKTGKISSWTRKSQKTGKLITTFDIRIERKEALCKFLHIVKPRKWNYRAETLGLVLISIRNPKKRMIIECELFKLYPDKKVHYSKEYRYYLRNMCEMQGLNVSKESIIKEIETTFTNQRYNKLSIYGEIVVSKLRYILK